MAEEAADKRRKEISERMEQLIGAQSLQYTMDQRASDKRLTRLEARVKALSSSEARIAVRSFMNNITDVLGVHVYGAGSINPHDRRGHTMFDMLRDHKDKLESFINDKCLALSVSDFERLGEQIRQQRDDNNAYRSFLEIIFTCYSLRMPMDSSLASRNFTKQTYSEKNFAILNFARDRIRE